MGSYYICSALGNCSCIRCIHNPSHRCGIRTAPFCNTLPLHNCGLDFYFKNEVVVCILRHPPAATPMFGRQRSTLPDCARLSMRPLIRSCPALQLMPRVSITMELCANVATQGLLCRFLHWTLQPALTYHVHLLTVNCELYARSPSRPCLAVAIVFDLVHV